MRLKEIFKWDDNRYWCWNWIFFIPECYFNDACVTHDSLYRWYNDYTRKQVDYIFLQDMLKLAEKKLIRIIQAYTFYTIVRLIGSFYFHK